MSRLRAIGWAAVSTPDQARDEKESIPAQRREIEAAAERLGLDLRTILEVPGFTRNYLDFNELRDDMLREGIDAAARLEQLWKTKQIDVLLVRDADRWGRTISVVARIGSELVAAGARIYLIAKGMWIDQKNASTLLALSGLMAQDELTRLRARYDMGMLGRFKRGLSGTRKPFTHIIQDNRLVVDESKRRLFTDLAEILLSGLGYHLLADEMAKRGHVDPSTGYPYNHLLFWRVFHSPFTYGHVARRFQHKWGAWAYDPTQPLPEGVEIIRDIIPRVWDPLMESLIIAELDRRTGSIRGTADPADTHRYTGLLRCDACGHKFIWNIKGYYYCGQPYSMRLRMQKEREAECKNRKYLREDIADKQIRDFLMRWREAERLDFAYTTDKPDYTLRLSALAEEIATIERRLEQLILHQATAPANTQDIYTRQIEEASKQLDNLQIEQRRIEAVSESPQMRNIRQLAYDELVQKGVDWLYEQPDRVINQTLHRLLARHQFIVQNGAIVGLHK